MGQYYMAYVRDEAGKHGTNMDMVGTWAMDTISFTKEWPSSLRELDYETVKFIED